ncbi:auxin-responsive protein SAUR32-like [Cicer arietinum]|uniref:Auxin-responsive protein SAUR32-like n=1 Tax=Cicer arietinum TaxID=3827 RepID=A0A1S2YG71_CICAR|nr:auxin-responsive protein SAUR32-like [Cicer arietinum]
MMKVKKGCLAVQVGLEEEQFEEEEVDNNNNNNCCQRFEIPISYLYHPLFKRLLDKAYDVYGYNAHGPLKLPCSVDDFLHLRWRIHKESTPYHHHHHHHHILPHTLSFNSC